MKKARCGESESEWLPRNADMIFAEISVQLLTPRVDQPDVRDGTPCKSRAAFVKALEEGAFDKFLRLCKPAGCWQTTQHSWTWIPMHPLRLQMGCKRRYENMLKHRGKKYKRRWLLPFRC
jgi:hypothetical protein